MNKCINHPEDLEVKDLCEKHHTELLRDAEKDLVERFVDDALPPESFDKILKRFLDDDSGYLQQLVGDYLTGDSSEIEQSAGDLARALIKHIKSIAEV